MADLPRLDDGGPTYTADAGRIPPSDADCSALQAHPTLKMFLAAAHDALPDGWASRACVQQGCGVTEILYPQQDCSRSPLALTTEGIYDGWIFVFDASNRQIGELNLNDVRTTCRGVHPACERITRCVLDPDYANTGRLCATDDDAGTEDAGMDDGGLP
jgi:hypothetical protein